jgi:protein-L-isoaspartate(D-aspartate) O-methyltransferase
MSGHDAGREGIGLTSVRARERLVEQLRAAGIADPRVLGALRDVPRHLFVEEALASRAYDNVALPIGHGQTISQPWVVARMLEAALAAGHARRALDIGTGSGYLAALLAQLVPEVYSAERIARLAARARRVLRELRIKNVALLVGDASGGLPAGAPFDVIVASAAAEEVPTAWLAQLAPGGRLVMPCGPPAAQHLVRITRDGPEYRHEDLGEVSFVPLLRGRG